METGGAHVGQGFTTQTSASFALRNNYQRYLLKFEMWLWDNADTLGPRPEEFNLPTLAATRSSSPHLHRARSTRDGDDGRGGRGG